MHRLILAVLTALVLGPPARAADELSLRADFAATCDGVADDRPAFLAGLAAAAAAGKPLIIAGRCTTSATLSVPANSRVEGRGAASVKAIGASGRIFAVAGVGNVVIRGLLLDGNRPSASNNYIVQADSATDVLFEDLTVVRAGRGPGVTGASQRVAIVRVRVTNPEGHGVSIQHTANDVTVRDSRLDGHTGFGIIVTDTANRIKLLNNTSYQGGLEMIGVTYGAHDIIIASNHAYSTGDNCYSLTGYNISFVGNIGVGCRGNGLNIYGHHTTAIGNYFRNNSQGYAVNSGWRAGIYVGNGGYWGSTSQHNVVVGNVTDDDQAVRTQQYGIYLAPPGGRPWVAGRRANVGSYVINAGSIYRATTAGLAGTTPPTHTSGAVSDGVVTWVYCNSFDAANDNLAASNQLGRAAIAGFLDTTGP